MGWMWTPSLSEETSNKPYIRKQTLKIRMVNFKTVSIVFIGLTVILAASTDYLLISPSAAGTKKITSTQTSTITAAPSL
jgi:hypothetical protein